MKKRALKKLFSRRKRVQASRDNRGFTLLELIITMAIFAVITVPIMNMFAKSAELNSKARTVQNTNDVAASVAEVINGIDLAAIGLRGKGVSEVPKDASGLDATEEIRRLFNAESVIDPWIDGAGKLTMQLHGVKSGGKKFDAAVSLDPAKNDYFIERNNEFITTAQDVTQSYSEGTAAGSTPLEKILADKYPGYTLSDVISHYRTIELTFYLDPTNNSVKAKVDFVYSFRLRDLNDPTVTIYCSNVRKNEPFYDAAIKTYDSDDGKKISFFLFYIPDYDSSRDLNDYIIINNPQNLSGDVFVIKQKKKGLTDVVQSSYSAMIDLVETHSSKTDSMNLKLGTNINIDHTDANYGKELSTGNFTIRNKISGTIYYTGKPEGSYVKISDYNRVYAYDIKVYNYDNDGNAHGDSESPLHELSGVRLR